MPGFGGHCKKERCICFLRSKNCSIYCLQGCHFTPEMENNVRSMWGFDCFFSSFRSNSRGVAILIKNNFEFKALRSKSDRNGNYLFLEALVENQHKILFCNIYAPNTDSPEFFEELFQNIDDFNNENLVICGDYNLVLDPELDLYNYVHLNNPQARMKLLEYIEEKDLIDAYRQFYPETRRYTWRRTAPLKQSRLDFFLISNSLLRSTSSCDIEPGYRTDHSVIILSLQFEKFEKGRGLWKFNNSLLYDKDFLELINNKIQDIKKQYAVPVYNFDNIENISNTEIGFTINDQLFLETLLMEIRGKTISYSSYIKKQKIQRENLLSEEINRLEQTLNEDTINLLNTKKNELENIRKERLKGAFIRFRAKWIEEGKNPQNTFVI